MKPKVEHREGMVEVYDWNGQYLGCMGIERWHQLLKQEQSKGGRMGERICGLQVFVDSNVGRGNAHVVTPPPQRRDFDSDQAYQAAYVKWQQNLVLIRGLDTERSATARSESQSSSTDLSQG